MTRALGIFGFTGGFLLISPAMRQMVTDSVSGGLGLLQQYSPFSYVGVVLVVFGGVSLTLISGSSPR